jgi:hypothetical protein
VPIGVNASMHDVRLLWRRWLDKHHRPEPKAGEPLNQSQDRAARLWLYGAVVAGGSPPRQHHGDQANDDGCL